MRTIRTKVYKFNELSNEAKEKAIEKLWDINIANDWWESIYDDAEQIGLKITGFDIDSGGYCEGEFQLSAHEVAVNIIKNHGEMCETNKKYGEGAEYEDKMMELEEEFEKSLLEDYRIMLQKEYEYMTSREAIKETIEMNEYEFTADGRMI